MDHNVQGRAKRVVPRSVHLLLGALAVFVAALMYLYIERQEDDLERHLAAMPNAGHPSDSSESAERKKLSGGAKNGVAVCKQEDDLAQRLETLRAAGHPTSLLELAEREKLPDGTKNAATVYMEASDAFLYPVEGLAEREKLPDGTNNTATVYMEASDAFLYPVEEVDIPILGDAELPEIGTPLPESMARAIKKYLQGNRECLALLHDAGGIEHCRFDRDERGQVPSWEIKRCTQLLVLDALYQAQRGDSDAAVTAITDTLRLCESLSDEPDLIGHTRRTAGIAFSLSGIERILNVTSVTQRQLKALDEACARAAASLDIARAMNVERCIIIESWTNPRITTEKQALVNILGATDKALLFSLDHMAECIEAVRLPTFQRLARMDEINQELEDMEARVDEMAEQPEGLSLEDPSVVEALIALTLPSVRRSVELDLFCRADLCTTRTALAVERYRLATNTRPETLQTLVPEYLDSVPPDPFDGESIRYRRTQSGYVVYSIWWDGQDNGGVRRGDVERGELFDSPFIMLR